MIVKPACPKCQLFYHPKKNAYTFLEGMPEADARSGKVDARLWHPYKLWHGDLWECRGCGAQVIVGVMGGPITEHYMPDFKDWLERMPPQVQINDC